MNSSAITEFDMNRQSAFKSRCFQVFLLHEIEAWQTECKIKRYVPLTPVASLPHSTLPFHESAFTYTNNYLNTPEDSLHVTFIKPYKP